MRSFVLAGLSTLLLFSGPTYSGENLDPLIIADARAQSQAYDLAAEYISQEGAKHSQVARELAPLKSTRDVYLHVENTPNNLSPLARLSPSAKEQLLKSLRFNDRGLITFDYTVLESLSPSEIYRILSLFGLQSGTHLIDSNGGSTMDSLLITPSMLPAGFLKGYRCEDPGSCAKSERHACTSNC